MLEYIILMIVGLAVGLGTGLLIKGRVAAGKIRDAEQEAGRMLANAKREADTKLKEAQLESKDKLYQARSDFDRETRDKRTELQNQERKLTQKEESLEKKSDAVEKREAEAQRRERELTAREKIAQEKEEKYEAGLREQRQMLEKIASMTAEEAKRQLMVAMEDEAKYEAAKTIKRIEDEAREEADKKSKSIISTAIQRYASDYVAEATVSVVNLPNDEMKGRIIGREGRNIRALEAATGIDLIIDDTPEAVILSCYDPLRREIAKQTIERLIHDGRIHPARIEELADKVRKDLDISMKDEGEKAAFDLGIHNLHPEIIKLIGRLRYRTSYGQNVLMHSREVAYFAGIMAAELGVDQKPAVPAFCMTWARPLTTKWRGRIPPSAAILPRSTASHRRSSIRSLPITGTAKRNQLRPCSWPRLTLSRQAGPVCGARPLRATSSGSRSLRRSPTPSRALRSPMPSRQGERSGSS